MRRLSLAKITKPTIRGVVRRPRLFKLLDRGRRVPAIWVSGPAGSGKTTLVASYLEARKLPCLWYQADEGDADIATFFYYLGLAARKAAPRSRRPMPLLTPEYAFGIPTFTKRYFEELSLRLDAPFVLVFDNYQIVSPDSPFHEIIQSGLSRLPQGIRTVIISRTEPPPAFARMQANGTMQGIGPNELRLSADESRGIVCSSGEQRLPGDVVRRIHEKTQGWAAGLTLVTASMRRSAMDPAVMDSFPSEGVFDYFANELFDKADPVTRHFLLKSSLLPKITVSAARMLTGIRQADRILSDLHRNNFFTEMRRDPGLSYQYHPLFRAFLLSRGESTYSASELSRTRSAAARLLEQSGQIEDAAELLRASRDVAALAGLIRRNAASLVEQGRFKTLELWLRSLPEKTLQNDPWLLYWLGACLLPVGPPESRVFLEKAFHLFGGQVDPAGELLAWSGIVDTYLYEWNDFTPLDRWILWLDRRVRDKKSLLPVEIERRVAISMFAALVIRQPHHPRAQHWLERALLLTDHHEDISLTLQARSYGAIYFAWIGDGANSQRMIHELDALAQASQAAPLVQLTRKWTSAAGALWLRMVPDEAVKMAADSLAFAGTTGVHVWDHMLCAVGFFGSICAGEPAQAQEFIEGMDRTLAPNRKHGYSHYHYLIAWQHLLAGDHAAALTHAESALSIAEETGFIFPLILCRIQTARVLIEKGRGSEAVRHITAAYALAVQSKSLMFQYMCLLTKAQIAFARKNETNGLRVLREALQLGRRHGYFSELWWHHPPSLGRLCAKALEARIEEEYVRTLVRKHRLVPEKPEDAGERWPWPLRIRTLGSFVIEHDGKPVRFSGKVQKKPLEMLKLLTSAGGNLSEAQVAEALWPDAEGDSARQSVKTTLHRLRQVLGDERAVRYQDGRVGLDTRVCWTDAAAFEQALAEAHALGEPDPRSAQGHEQRRLLERAVAQYRGNLLEADGDRDREWALSPRERLRSKFLRAVTALAASCELAGRTRKAVDWYLRGLDVDDLAEELYLGLMQAYRKLGRKAEVIKTYHRYQSVLASTVGVDPSPEAKALYRLLLQ